VLNRHEARNQIHGLYLRSSPSRARCLTLALAPNGAGSGSHLRFTNVTLGCPLATRARVGHPTTLERHHATGPLRLFHPPGAHESGIESQPLSRAEGWTSRRFAPRTGEPSLHYRFASLVSEAARLRHGQGGAAISRPGLLLGRAGKAGSPASPSRYLRLVGDRRTRRTRSRRAKQRHGSARARG